MQRPPRQRAGLAFTAVALSTLFGAARAQDTIDEAAARLDALQRELALQGERLQALRRAVADEQRRIDELRRTVTPDVLEGQRGGAAPRAVASPDRVAQANPPQPVGQAPERETRPPQAAPIFEQPGVLTPRGKWVLEPSLQYSYSSSNRVSLVGYTIIPALLIGLIDVREVKRSTYVATLTGRYGLTNRFEIEGRLPYVYRSDATVARRLAEGAPSNEAFDASGSGIGDIELTARYQFNDGGADGAYYIGSLRFKSRTGKDPFEVRTSLAVPGLEGLQSELPRGSGFYGIQPALTVLYPSDPAVLFGTVSYLHSVARSGVVQNTDEEPVARGKVRPGGVFGFNFGLGLALNEKTSFSIGYDHASVGKIRQNGVAPPDAVRVQLGTLLLGYSYRLDDKRTANVSLGVGVTRDTPDMTLTVRVPTTF
jgi:hypothetical protein